ncbi:MAG: protein-glutamate O-methyltransferase CheR [Lentisphaerota bacterium]
MNTNFDIEYDLLLEAIRVKFNNDFSQYAKASLTRRIQNFLIKESIPHLGELTHRLLESEDYFIKFKNAVSVTVTEMFRDPEVFKSIRENVFPYLATYPEINIWHAGCATGQEVYSLAIMLKEEGIYDKTNIYATDMNNESLDIAREGIYTNEMIKSATINFQKTNPQKPFSDYYHSKYGKSIINPDIRKNVTFIEHNLVNGKVFYKFNFIICRNVMIYFTRELQSKILNLLSSSLITNGFLCLGTKESIDFIDTSRSFSMIDNKSKIYQKCKK